MATETTEKYILSSLASPRNKIPLQAIWNCRKQCWMLRHNLIDEDIANINKFLLLENGVESLRQAILANPAQERHQTKNRDNTQAILIGGEARVQHKGPSYRSDLGVPLTIFLSTAISGAFTLLNNLSSQTDACLQTLKGFAPNTTEMFASVNTTIMEYFNSTFNQFPLIDPRGSIAENIYQTIFNLSSSLLTSYYEQQLQTAQAPNEQQQQSVATQHIGYGIASLVVVFIGGVIVAKLSTANVQKNIAYQREQQAYDTVLKPYADRLHLIEQETNQKNYIIGKLEAFLNKANKNAYIHLVLSPNIDLENELQPRTLKDYLLKALENDDDSSCYENIMDSLHVLTKNINIITNTVLVLLISSIENYGQEYIEAINIHNAVKRSNNIYSLFCAIVYDDDKFKDRIFAFLCEKLINLLQNSNGLQLLHLLIHDFPNLNAYQFRGCLLIEIDAQVTQLVNDDIPTLEKIIKNFSRLDNDGIKKTKTYFYQKLLKSKNEEEVATCLNDFLSLIKNKKKFYTEISAMQKESSMPKGVTTKKKKGKFKAMAKDQPSNSNNSITK